MVTPPTKAPANHRHLGFGQCHRHGRIVIVSSIGCPGSAASMDTGIAERWMTRLASAPRQAQSIGLEPELLQAEKQKPRDSYGRPDQQAGSSVAPIAGLCGDSTQPPTPWPGLLLALLAAHADPPALRKFRRAPAAQGCPEFSGPIRACARGLHEAANGFQACYQKSWFKRALLPTAHPGFLEQYARAREAQPDLKSKWVRLPRPKGVQKRHSL